MSDKMVVSLNEDGEIVLKKLNKSPVERAFGMLKMEDAGIEYERKLRNEWKGR